MFDFDFFSLETLVLICAAIGCISTLAAIALPLLKRDSVSTRLKSVSMRREELQRMQKEKLQKKATARYQSSARVGVMKTILEKVNLQQMIASKELRNRLAQSGVRGQSAVISFVFMRFSLPIAFSLVAMLMMAHADSKILLKIMIVGAAGLAGFYLPGLLVSNRIQARQQILRSAFPDAVDLLLICVESGLSVEAAFNKVTEEMADTCPLLAEELGLTSAELAFLPERRQAYENLVMRTGLPPAKSLSTALIQSEKYGTPVAVALRVVSQESRESRMAIAEKKAGSLPAKLTVPMIAFFLPVLFVVILGPAIIQVIHQMSG